MPLPLLAAAATQAATLFSYNRQNFMYNRGQQVTRAFTGLNYKLQQFALYRQDIRDLVGLTTDKMSNYHVVACLELGMCATLMGPARLKADVPEWVLFHQLVSLCAAFAFLVSSMWFATRAAVAADSFNVRLQTQWIRLPVPDDELLDSALTRAEAFETEGMADMLRLPVVSGIFRKVFYTGGSGGGDAKEEGEAAAASGDEGEAKGPRGSGLQHAGSSMSLNSLTALQMYQQLQRNWSCYDAYARVTMSVGTYWLAISLAYYEIGWTLCHQQKGLPALAAAMMFCGVIVLLIYVDVFLSSQRLAGVALLVIAGPAFAALGASLELRDSHATHWCSVVVGVIHLVLSVWFWHVGSIVPGKADLPTRFKGVVYLDIFGPIVRQIRSYLDQTGLGQHAVVCSEDAEDEIAGLSAVKECASESSPTISGHAKHRWQCLGDACRAAEAAGISTSAADGLKASPTPSGLRRDVRRVRRLLLDWKEGAVGQHMGDAQHQELNEMFSEMDAAHRRLQADETPEVLGLPISQAGASSAGYGNIAGSQQRSHQKTMEYCDMSPAGFGGGAGSLARSGREEPPTILRSLSASSNGPHTPVWTRVERDRQGTGRYEYWVGSSKSATKDGKGKACFNDSPPKDAPFVELKDVQALCGELLARAGRLDPRAADRDRFLQGAVAKDASPSSVASLLPRCGGGEEDSPRALLDVPKNRHRKGHQPVVAYRVMSASLVLVWLIGFVVHLVRLPEVRTMFSGTEIGDFGSSRRLGGSPLAAFSWPEPFFRPLSLHCQEEAALLPSADGGSNSTLRLIASNGYLVYRLGAVGSAGAGAPRPLSCPVEEHEALISSRCKRGREECRAVVAAEGGLWECLEGGEAPRLPLATLPRSYQRPRDSPLLRWAAAGEALEVFFAAPRRGNIVQLRRRGSELRPVAELEPPLGAPVLEEWLSLAVVRGSAEDLLLAVALPGPTVFSWSLQTGRHLGAWPLRGVSPTWWCATSSGLLYSASTIEDSEADGVELSPWPLPRMA